MQVDAINYESIFDSTPIPLPDWMHQSEQAGLGFDHAVLGGHVMVLWKIPDPMPQVVAWHHQSSRAQEAELQIARLVDLVRLGDFLESWLARTDTQARDFQQLELAEMQRLGISSAMLVESFSEMIQVRQRALDLFTNQ